MKNYLIITGLCLSTNAFGQSTNNTASIDGKNHNISIGEMCMIHTVKSNSLIITQGVLQSDTKVFVAQETNAAIQIFPNPNNGNFTIAFSNTALGVANWKLLDATGKILVQNKFIISDSHFNLPIQLQSVMAGNYFLEVNIYNQKTQFKISIQ